MTAAAEDRNFKNYAKTQEEEDAFDYTKLREGLQKTSLIGSMAHLVKGALGAGVMSGHVAYLRAGIAVAIPINILCGIYMGTCLYLLVFATQILLRRTRKPFLSYADSGEAAMMLFPKPWGPKYAKYFRHLIETLICMDLFGSCCAYNIIIGKSIKQLVENTQHTSLYSQVPGYPGLRLYIALFIPFMVALCLIRSLKYLAPFSLLGNAVVASTIFMAIGYCFVYNPEFKDLTLATDFVGALRYIGMQIFSMSCCAIVIPVESNMKNPKLFPVALFCGMGFIILTTFSVSLFGYAAFREESASPITINFPMTAVAKCFKALIIFMIYMTHGINFWVPFNLCWYYIKKKITSRHIAMWERIWRAIFVVCIICVGIAFPTINDWMAFIGCFCLSNMAFIWPNMIYLLVIYERPGFGKYNWRLWRSVIFLIVGFFVLCVGTVINAIKLVNVLSPGANVNP